MYSHTVSGRQVLVDDLSARQIAHPARYLDSHVDQVLLGDGLDGGKQEEKASVRLREKGRGK